METAEPHENGVVLFETAAPGRALAEAIGRGAQAVLAEYGEDRYREAWGHPFPLAALQTLQAGLGV